MSVSFNNTFAGGVYSLVILHGIENWCDLILFPPERIAKKSFVQKSIYCTKERKTLKLEIGIS